MSKIKPSPATSDQQCKVGSDSSRSVGRGGFSLFELLFAVMIIGVLAALMLPVIGMIRNSAATTKCVSMQRQFAAAAFAFANDNRGAMPAHYSKDAGGIQQAYWFGNVAYAQYLDDNKAQIDSNKWPKRLRCPTSQVTTWFPMGMNGSGIDFERTNVVWFRTMRSIPTPTETMLIGDANDWNVVPNATLKSGEPANAAPSDLGYGSMMSARHRGRVNASFYDGHAESLAQRTVESYTWTDPFWFISTNCQNRPYQ